MPSNLSIRSSSGPALDTSATREAWLRQAVEHLAVLFRTFGYEVPPVSVSIGFSSTGVRSHAVGQCWQRSRADDQVNHVFISPVLGSAYEAIDTLAHELIHAVDDCEHRHGAEFKKIALALGMEGPMRSASAGPKLKARLEEILSKMPVYPHGKLNVPPRRASGGAPPRATCEICGYRLSIPKRFLNLGAPICPVDRVQMQESGDWA